MDGKILRKERTCRHSASQKCTECLPLDVCNIKKRGFKKNYLKRKEILFLKLQHLKNGAVINARSLPNISFFWYIWRIHLFKL